MLIKLVIDNAITNIQSLPQLDDLVNWRRAIVIVVGHTLFSTSEGVGRATSGGYGWRCGKSLALAMLAPEMAAPGTELEITILGVNHRATVIPDSPFDPDNTRLRG